MSSYSFHKLSYVAGVISVLLASFLTFLVQPLAGKILLFDYGGSATVWLTSIFFFQTALLFGYIMGGMLEGRPARLQAGVVVGLGLLALVSTNLRPEVEITAYSRFTLLWDLCIRLGPALLLTTSIAIVQHSWLRRLGQTIPYFLYALSNIGSLFALGLYPFLIEPHFSISMVSQAWFGGFFLLVALVSLSALGMLGKAGHGTDQDTAAESENTGVAKLLTWMGIPFVLTVLMMSTTDFIGHEIGSHPLSWTPPLAIFLGAYTLAFLNLLPIVLVPYLLGIGGFFLFLFLAAYSGLKMTLGLGAIGTLLLTQVFFSLALVSILYDARSKESYGKYYISTAFGGCCAGVFCVFIAPHIFNMHVEFYLSLLLSFLVGVLYVLLRKKDLVLLSAYGISGAILVMLGLHLLQPGKGVEYVRNEFSIIKLIAGSGKIDYMNGRTLHGSVFVDEEKASTPTTYYWRESGIGSVIALAQENNESLRIGTVGLGAGTLATYLRDGDSMVFWEIDPASVWLANDVFRFIPNSKGQVDVKLVDGRIGLRNHPDKLDMLILDAFSGDGIPPHLCTLEAVQEYLAKTPDGVLCFHISNRYMKLGKVLTGIGDALGMDYMEIRVVPSETDRIEEGATPSSWFFLYPEAWAEKMNSLSQTVAAEGTADRKVKIFRKGQIPGQLWTDEKNAVWPIVVW